MNTVLSFDELKNSPVKNSLASPVDIKSPTQLRLELRSPRSPIGPDDIRIMLENAELCRNRLLSAKVSLPSVWGGERLV